VQLHWLSGFHGQGDVSHISDVGDLHARTAHGQNFNAVSARHRYDQIVGTGEHAAKFKLAVRAGWRLILIVQGGWIEKAAIAHLKMRHQKKIGWLCELPVRSRRGKSRCVRRSSACACPHIDIDAGHIAAFGDLHVCRRISVNRSGIKGPRIRVLGTRVLPTRRSVAPIRYSPGGTKKRRYSPRSSVVLEFTEFKATRPFV
jgi:hypothetical protein